MRENETGRPPERPASGSHIAAADDSSTGGESTLGALRRIVAGDPYARTPRQRREHIARTIAGLDRVRAEGRKLGKPYAIGPELTARIVELRQRPLSLRAIAAVLNDEGVPTAYGGRRWYASTIKAVLDRPEKPS